MFSHKPCVICSLHTGKKMSMISIFGCKRRQTNILTIQTCISQCGDERGSSADYFIHNFLQKKMMSIMHGKTCWCNQDICLLLKGLCPHSTDATRKDHDKSLLLLRNLHSCQHPSQPSTESKKHNGFTLTHFHILCPQFNDNSQSKNLV